MFDRLKAILANGQNASSDKGLDSLDPASNDFANAVVRLLNDNRGVHAETAITGAGAIAGNCLLRASGHDVSKLEPGSAVFSNEVNDSGPKIIGVMSIVCSKLGIDPNSGWNSLTPVNNTSLRPLIDLIRLLRPEFERVIAAHGIGKDVEPLVAAAAAIKLIKMASGSLNPEIGKAIAVNALVAGGKTVPYPN